MTLGAEMELDQQIDFGLGTRSVPKVVIWILFVFVSDIDAGTFGGQIT